MEPEMIGPVESEHTPTDGAAPAESSGVARDTPRPEPARSALVELWAGRVRQARSHWDYAFKRMREDMRFARGYQWPGQKRDSEEDRYTANLVQRHISQRVAALYAKNPKAVAHRRRALDFQVWDGNPDTVMQAQMVLQMAAQMGPEGEAFPEVQQAMQLLQDVESGKQRKELFGRMGKTLELVYDHQVHEQSPPTKKSMKRLVRRTVTTGVGYVKLGYHRQFQRDPEDQDRINDMTEQLAVLERLSADQQDGQIQPNSAEVEELRILLQRMEQEQEITVREGLALSYPRSTSIVPDTTCTNLDGFLGCRWVAQEFLLSPESVQQAYNVDLGKAFTRYSPDYKDSGVTPASSSPDDPPEVGPEHMVCVWEVYDKSTGHIYTLADGHPDFLREPGPPPVRLERFWPWFTLQFNEIEDEYDIFPPSDVSLLRDMQVEHNVARQRLREHRDANRPKHATSKGSLDEQDKSALTGSEAHTVVELNGLAPGQSLADILQPVPHNPIDPNLYEVGSYFEDVLKVSGSQEANLGGSAGITATESSIAESSRMTTVGSNIDDLDDLLTELARAASQVLLTEMSPETVMEIVGPGAVWPELSAQDVARELWLEVKAGSSGRPNKAQEIQNFERLAPFLIQIPGTNPRWLLEQAVERLDDRMDLDEAFMPSTPSIVAQNGQTQPGTGNPGTDPNAQGPAGAANGPSMPQGDTNMGPNNPGIGPPDQTGRPTPIARGVAPSIQQVYPS
jgi:hypothetical protein